MADTSGWKSLGINDPTRYQATFLYNQTSGRRNSQKDSKQEVVVITNRVSGNYDAYAVGAFGGRSLIYQYNASNDDVNITNQNQYNKLFTGKNAVQYTNLNKGVKEATLNLAEKNLSGQTSRKEYNLLQQKLGYKSVANIAPPPPDPPVLPAPGTTLPEGSLEGADTRGESLSGDKLPVQTLRYPTGSPPPGFPFDFIQITSYKYVPAGLDYINTPNKVGESVESRYGNQTAITTVSLPMQPNLSESHSVGWGGDSLDPIKAMLASTAMGTIKDIGSIKNIQNELGKLGDNLQSLGNDPDTIQFIAAYFAGQAVGANITGRTTGQVINPNMELLFSGPSLRTFNFQFRLTPRDDTEAKVIRQIIKSFKSNMAVQRSTSNLFLMAPNIFKLKYISGDGSTATEQHPFLNKFKPCAMTGFNVNYTPDGSYMTFENKSLTSYDISMSFSELEPIYQDDYTNDYNSNDMGF